MRLVAKRSAVGSSIASRWPTLIWVLGALALDVQFASADTPTVAGDAPFTQNSNEAVSSLPDKALVAQHGASAPVRYVLEEREGLSLTTPLHTASAAHRTVGEVDKPDFRARLTSALLTASSVSNWLSIWNEPTWDAPEVSLFVAADDEAISWSLNGEQSQRAKYQNNRVDIGNLAVGVAWSAGDVQLGLAYVERNVTGRLNDREQSFAGLTATMKR